MKNGTDAQPLSEVHLLRLQLQQLEQDKPLELPPIPPPPSLTGGNVIIFPKRGKDQKVRGWGDD